MGIHAATRSNGDTKTSSEKREAAVSNRISALITKTSAAIVCALALSLSASADVADIARECDQCHGENGISTESDVPIIAGMSAFVLEDYLLTYQDQGRPCHETEYRSGDVERPATSMCEIAAELSEDDVAAIAEHYAARPFVPAQQSFDADKATAGAGIHKRDCEKCHTDNASNPEDDAGIMAGQWMPYLQQVFEDYSSGEREMIEKKMREKFDSLSDEDKQALIHFYGSLQ
jgi:sulfide dehydrogenase cytochrome subunit